MLNHAGRKTKQSLIRLLLDLQFAQTLHVADMHLGRIACGRYASGTFMQVLFYSNPWGINETIQIYSGPDMKE